MTLPGAPFPSLKPGRLRLTEHYLCTEGEGRTLGALTYLVRLSGCDLRCSWCDSKFSSFYDDEERAVPVAKVEAAALKSGAAWVSFTGGEPTYRSAGELKTLAGLAGRLRKRGMKVKVESNGRQLPAALKSCVDLWSLAPKWDSRQAPAKARTKAMDYDEGALALFAKRYAPDKLQLKFVISYDALTPRAADLERARLILKPLPKMPVFFIPEAYAPGDYLGRTRALEQAVMALGKGGLKGWDLRVQPQMHRILHGDQRGR
jgi:7-carboxy-7-deazaguanine synthase